MRTLVLIGIAAALCAIAIFAARATSAHAFIPTPGPDPGVAGGGYVVMPSGAPNIEVNRVRFELALRMSQVDGSIRGKSLTVRAFGALTCAVDAFCGTKYVARSWALTPYPGIPAPFGGGSPALISPCSMWVGIGYLPVFAAGFSGVANLFLVDPAGFEHFTGITFPYGFNVLSVGPDTSPAGDGVAVVEMPGGPPLPMPLPSGELAAGNLGYTEGVFAPSCGFPSGP